FGFRRLGEQSRGLHELPGLAVTALGDVLDQPGLLERFRLKTFDRRHTLSADFADGDLARAIRLAVEMHGAGAADSHAASELGAGPPAAVAHTPQQGYVGRTAALPRLAVDHDRDLRHVRLPSGRSA